MDELSVKEKARLFDEQRQKLSEAGRKGGLTPKTFTRESKNRQREGARKGGSQPKSFTPETKKRQIEGCKLGGQHSHIHDKRGGD